jgi:hypothetical protein
MRHVGTRSLRAAARTPSSPRDPGTRLCVRSGSDCSAFSSVSSLPSTDSAGVGGPPLFARFFGTMELSDSPETYLSDVRHRAFSDRSASGEMDVSGVSRLPRGKFPTVHVVSDSVGVTGSLPNVLDITVAFPLSGQGRPPQRNVFGAQYTARLCLCERFAWTVARPDASLEAEATG